MKNAIIVALALVAVVNGQDGIPKGICEPYSTKSEDCNSCFCVEDGSGWACTQVGCGHAIIEISKQDDTPIRRDEQSSRSIERDVDAPFYCVPNVGFPMDCNWCICSEDGLSAACTSRGCLFK